MKDPIHAVLPQETLPMWHLYKQSHDATCKVVKVALGFESRIFLDGRYLYSRQFAGSVMALQWALLEQARLRRDGWSRTTTLHGSTPASAPASIRLDDGIGNMNSITGLV